MDKVIFSDFGIEIIDRDNQLFIRYDAGEIVVEMREHPITLDDAEKAKTSSKDAYEVLLKCQNA